MALANRPGPVRRTDRVVLGPAVVRRRCRLPYAVLEDLGSDRVWQLAGAWAEAEDASVRLGGDLADRLGALVPEVPKAQRGELLRARRAAFNSRPLPTGWSAQLYPERLCAAYTHVLRSRESARRKLLQELAVLARHSGEAVDALLGDPDLAWSVELSVPGLRAAGPVGALDATAGKRARRRALTLLRLVQRAATKPTPFARFATTDLLFRDGAPVPPRSHVRVERAALEWVRQWIAAGGHRSLRPDRMWVTVNPSATVYARDGAMRVTWLVSGRDGAERFVSARCSPALDRTLRRLREPVRLNVLAGGGEPPAWFEGLAGRGLLEVGPVLPGHGPDTLDAAVHVTDPASDSAGDGARTAREVHDGFRALRDAEDAVGDAGAGAERTGALHRARDGVGAIASALGVTVRAAERWPVSEDVVGVGADEGVLRVCPEMLADLGRVQRIVPLLGFELPFQLATAIAFRRRFGTDAVPAAAAYQWFLETGRGESDALLADCTSEDLVAVRKLRTRLFEGLRAAADANSTEVQCDPDLLESVAADLPDAVMELSCAAWPVQLAGDRVVVNGVGSGYGRFAARVAAGLDEDRTSVLRAWAAAADTPREGGVPVDIAASLGATVNEHPLLLPAALSCPGRALECDPQARIDLSECSVRAVGGQLLLFCDRFGSRPLFPVPHNATLATVAPGVYRWLSRFGPASGATLALWDHVDALASSADPGTVRAYPRLVLGRLVLSRRTWKVPGAALPDVGPEDGAQGVPAWHRWCARTGVPRRSFLRTTTFPDPWDVVRGLADKSQVLAARATTGAAIRKPLYVDLSQPLCRPAVTAAADDTLTFTEPLPGPADADGDGRVTEYVLETSQPPRAPVTGGAD